MKYWRTQDIGFRGIAYPFRVDDRGCVVENVVDLVEARYDTIRQAIEQVLLTVKGSRFFHRSFHGAPIHILYRMNTPEELALIRSEIEDFLRRWEPRCALTKFEIVLQEENIAIVRVEYKILRTQLKDWVTARLPWQPGP